MDRQPDRHSVETALRDIVPANRLIDDPLGRLAYATDASFYRLEPKAVVVLQSEDEVRRTLDLCNRIHLPVTFRAAGTSLSGQAVTDQLLAVLGDGWNQCHITDDGSSITLGPGVIGGEANRRLAPFGRKIGPDPASINAAKIGGIAANNASGMCCGTAQNSYQTLAGMRLLLADGTLLDTRDPESRAAFSRTHAGFLSELSALAATAAADQTLAQRIRHKFKIKNTTGYSLNALLDFTDPIDILQHLMIGSEGTLGFISEITYRTVPEHKHKATALLFFPTIEAACLAVTALKATPVSAVELVDRAGLRAVQDKPGMPDAMRHLPDSATALLVEVRGEDPAQLYANRDQVVGVLAATPPLHPIDFSEDPTVCARYWTVRKGLFPMVGAMRQTGTTVIIEDVAFPIENLAAATKDLQNICAAHGYGETIIFGHALEGNLHFVFTQDFSTDQERDRYRRFMDAVCEMVVKTYDGSLKAEHGTGRNMAPFVEMEWGREAYRLMQAIKQLFDPRGLLNPGVILNGDPDIHVKNLKPLPAADPLVDKCIECGFCEPLCPSRGLTLTPRQRIVGWREIARRERAGEQGGLDRFKALYDYKGIDTCAACGLCATACPVGIETGLLTKQLRGRRRGKVAHAVADRFADHYGAALSLTKLGLSAAGVARRVLGGRVTDSLGKGLHKASAGALPLWTKSLPTAARFSALPTAAGDAAETVVYVPSCAARAMGPAVGDPQTDSLPTVMQRLMERAGFKVVYPPDLDGLCCGQPFDSKGLAAQADAKAAEMEAALRQASENGRHAVVMDTSPCSYRMKCFAGERLALYDVTEFLHDQVLPRLTVRRKADCVALHVTCSTTKMGLTAKLQALAEALAETVIVPDGISCCGFAGDKGFTLPDLNAHALRSLAAQLPFSCSEGVSTSRTCEIGASQHSGRFYRSIAYLMDRCTAE